MTKITHQLIPDRNNGFLKNPVQSLIEQKIIFGTAFAFLKISDPILKLIEVAIKHSIE